MTPDRVDRRRRLTHARPVPPVVPDRLRVGVRAEPLGDLGAGGRVPAVAVDDQDPAEALPVEGVEQVADDACICLHPECRAAGIRRERRRQPVREHRQDRDADRLRRLDRDPLGEDVVGAQREVGVLLGRAERQHDSVVALEVGLELHPVQIVDPHWWRIVSALQSNGGHVRELRRGESRAGSLLPRLRRAAFGRLPVLRRRESSARPVLPLVRRRTRGRHARAGDAARASQDGHRRLLRRHRLDHPRRASGSRIPPPGHGPLLRRDEGGARAARRDGREIHRRRRDGRLRHSVRARGRRAARRARGGGDAARARQAERGARANLGRADAGAHRREHRRGGRGGRGCG